MRSGSTAAYDVNFGKEVGAAAVMLLMQGITGVTVYQVVGNRIRYMPTKDAIVERYVDLDLLSFYEQMDVCFGRKQQPFEPVFVENDGSPVERFM